MMTVILAVLCILNLCFCVLLLALVGFLFRLLGEIAALTHSKFQLGPNEILRPVPLKLGNVYITRADTGEALDSLTVLEYIRLPEPTK